MMKITLMINCQVNRQSNKSIKTIKNKNQKNKKKLKKIMMKLISNRFLSHPKAMKYQRKLPRSWDRDGQCWGIPAQVKFLFK
jgi:mRNA-degrading endonuclease YafQ of YafQ-DinJ toxin-antitoxin module